MSQEEAWLAVARECPRRIIPALHRSGKYVHGTTAHLPGKVLCIHVSSTRPPGWRPTASQAEAEGAIAAASAIPCG
jgi:hypothetical protein